MPTRALEDLFVDRQKQLERFRKSLEGASGRKIILVTAGAGMGKSWLLRRFAQEGEARGAATVRVDFSDGQAYDVLTLVRRFRDALGPASFSRLNATLNEVTAPRLIIADKGDRSGPAAAVRLDGAQGGTARIGVAADRNSIRDNLFIVQTDNPLLLQAVEERVTQAFFACLDGVVAASPALFLFDSYERTSQEGERWVSNTADRWIQRELLARISDGRLANTVVVLAGRRLPSLDASWAPTVGELPVELLTVDDVAEYLRRNRGLASLTDAEVQALYNAVQGNPQLLGIIGDSLERSASGGAPDDDW